LGGANGLPNLPPAGQDRGRQTARSTDPRRIDRPRFPRIVPTLGIDKDFIIRGLLTVADKPPSYEVENIRRHGEAVQAVFGRFSRALKAAVDFARDEGLVTPSLISPVATLFPVIYYLSHQEDGSVPQDQRRPLRTLLYFLLFNRFLGGRAPDARIRYLRDWHLKPAGAGPLPLDAMLRTVAEKQKYHYTSTTPDLLNAHKTLALSIAQPRVYRQTLTWQSRTEVDHIFPQAKYREKYPELIDDIGNLAFLEKLPNILKSATEPAEYFAEMEYSDSELLDRYLVERELLVPERFEEFVESRRGRILDKVKSFLGR